MATICEQFRGRLRDLCEGQGRDGRADPPPDVSARFRMKYGLAPLSDDPEERARQLAEVGELPAAVPVAAQVPANGPGRQLETIFQELQIPYQEACGCPAYARQMDLWGIRGCEEHFEEIVERLRSNAAKYSLWEHLSAAGRALWTGLAFQVNPFDPFPGFVREAIRRAAIIEEQEHQNCGQEQAHSELPEMSVS